MKLVIHDLPAAEWEKLQAEYAGDRIVADQGTIRPCVGCFRCWNKTPGECAVRDGYENMGALIHRADEVVVISRYTYGGFSAFVKNVFDRSLGYVLPQFEVVGGETHHQKRYAEDKPFTFLFYGHDLSAEEKESARRYVKAVCANIRGYVKDVRFSEREEQALPEAPQAAVRPSGRTVLLIGSMRARSGNSAKLARKLGERLRDGYEIVPLPRYLARPAELYSALESAETLVLCVPLYVDGLPAQVIRFLEGLRQYPRRGIRRVYVLANMGLYESSQLVNLFSAVKQWCGKTGTEYCGGLGVSAGELLGALTGVTPFRLGPTRRVAEGMDALADAIRRGNRTEDIYAEPFGFPRSLYIGIANANWNRTARKNGVRPEELYRRLEPSDRPAEAGKNAYPNMDLTEAMRARHSVRSYTGKPIGGETLETLEKLIEECNRESGLHIQLVRGEPMAFGGAMAHYGKFSGVRNYFALVGKKSRTLDEACGYYGEKLVLAAQALGLNTCWVGLTFRKVPDVFRVDAGERLALVIAVGYGTAQGAPRRSKTVADVSCAENAPEWFTKGVEAALLAPTAINQQKFFFTLRGDKVSAGTGLGPFSRIDLGIAKYHFELGSGKDRTVWL